MSTRRIVSTSSTAIYVIALIAIIVIFLLLGGGAWIKEIMHGSFSLDMANWKWAQILISLAIGFVLGLIFARRRW